MVRSPSGRTGRVIGTTLNADVSRFLVENDEADQEGIVVIVGEFDGPGPFNAFVGRAESEVVAIPAGQRLDFRFPEFVPQIMRISRGRSR